MSRDPNGRPLAVLTGRAVEVAAQAGIVEVALSLSFTSELAIANAMAITAEARPKPKESKEDERAVIARSFREARSVLDDLERVQDTLLEEHAAQPAPQAADAHAAAALDNQQPSVPVEAQPDAAASGAPTNQA